MRITADIIDDESIFLPKEILGDNHSRGTHSRSRNVFGLDNDLSPLVSRKHRIPVSELHIVPPHSQTVHEVTQRFKNLNLCDIHPSSSSDWALLDQTMQLEVNNLPKGCKAEELKALFSQYGTVKKVDVLDTLGLVEISTIEDAENASKALDKYSFKGSLLSVGPFGLKDPKVESPPVWFCYHMSKIKQEIKKELVEELLNVSSESRQAQTDTPHAKASVVVKEDTYLQCQGEVVHNDIYCDNCDQLIHGIRYKCGNCSDFDLCQECESLPNVHNKNHIFLKIRYPYALKMFQKQKWHELMTPLPIKPARFNDSHYSKIQRKKLYEAKFLCDETVPDGTVIPPSTRFVKSWKVMNNGYRVWTHATKLHLIQGSADLIPSSEQVDVPHLNPGEEGIVSILFTSPATPGVYRSHWNFCHKSRPFGQIVWCHIIVKPQEELKNQLSVPANVNQLTESIVNDQMEASNIAQVLTAVKENERENMVPRKLIVNSHTATPNNTPFAVTPPKSPDHVTFQKSVCEIASDKAFLGHCNDSDNDDECSIVSLTSTESDTEFVMIPMPKCFNLSESFINSHFTRLPQTAEIDAKDFAVEEAKEAISFVPQRTIPFSKTVSQETGVPELSENICKFTIVENSENSQQITEITQVTGGSSSEISIIESENSSPSDDNALPTFDAVNVSISANNVGNVDEVTTRLVDIATDNAESASKEVIQDQVTDIPSSATFPKFPVEGVSGDIYEGPLNLNNSEERTIQVLPEGLVFGALSAAASVYNTAKAVISTIQQPKDNMDGLSQPLPGITATTQQENLPIRRPETLNHMDQLIEMGFCNRVLNDKLLKKHKGDVASVVAELVNLNDNEWYASRHVSPPTERVPPSPPGFLD